ncbi:hypothetical protein [Phytohabitans aurantiacus]|uniref:Heme exporter protein D n=1 Tax=Phytohabitans aurantiacus TaxID=3016789 RepID=A0ABQ5R2Z0_9ACTN|nr:hypothetical protein [Phytohabitans aurantiacus]GLH99945.1 hypothetical protein Pa4123_52210 [Phytohabitans aurantiacus]
MPLSHWAALLYTAAVLTLAATYLWSKDAGRRKRAMILLRRLTGRR